MELEKYTDQQLTNEMMRRLGPNGIITTSILGSQAAKAEKDQATSAFRETRTVLIVTGVYTFPTAAQLSGIRKYESRKSVRRVDEVRYDSVHKCIRIVTWNASHGQNFRDDHDWLAGKATKDAARIFWTDKNGVTRVRGLLQKLGIKFKSVIQG